MGAFYWFTVRLVHPLFEPGGSCRREGCQVVLGWVPSTGSRSALFTPCWSREGRAGGGGVRTCQGGHNNYKNLLLQSAAMEAEVASHDIIVDMIAVANPSVYVSNPLDVRLRRCPIYVYFSVHMFRSAIRSSHTWKQTEQYRQLVNIV